MKVGRSEQNYFQSPEATTLPYIWMQYFRNNKGHFHKVFLTQKRANSAQSTFQYQFHRWRDLSYRANCLRSHYLSIPITGKNKHHACTTLITPTKNIWERLWKKSNKSNKTKANFYVIFTGNNSGVYYQWSDCIPHIQRDNTTQFKGYQNLADAYRALERKQNSSHIYAWGTYSRCLGYNTDLVLWHLVD